MLYNNSLFGLPEEYLMDKNTILDEDFKILTWNLQSPSKERVLSQWQYLKNSSANILIITELKNNEAFTLLIDILKGNGYQCFFTISNDDYITVIASYQFKTEELTTNKKSSLTSRVVGVRISNNLKLSINIYGVYAPTCGGQFATDEKDEFKRLFHSEFLEYVRSNNKQNQNTIIIGDLNILEPDHYPKNGYFKKWEYQYTDLIEYPLVDLFKFAHPNSTEHSWVSSRTREGQRLDHVFGSKKLCDLLKGIAYIHEVRFNKLSDHSLMKLKIST